MKTAKLKLAYWTINPPEVYVDNKGNIKGGIDLVYLSYTERAAAAVRAYREEPDGFLDIGYVPNLSEQWASYLRTAMDTDWEDIEAQFFRGLGYEVTQ